MTLYGEPRVWLEDFPLGRPVPFDVDHLGLNYHGEVIRAESWDPHWGEALTGDIYFRIVLLRQRRGSHRPAIQDSRIALCRPGAGLSRRRNRLSGELSTIKETMAVYLTQRDTEAGLIRSTLQRSVEELEDQLLGEESVSYSEGEIFSGTDQTLEPAAFFMGLNPIDWFNRLANSLLTRAYPSLPINEPALDRTINTDDLGRLYSSIFAQPGSSPDILDELGPALALSFSPAPEYLDLSACPVERLIRNRLSDLPSPAPYSGLHHFLAHQMGLTGPLSNLYLILYLFLEKPELQVRLSPGHELSLITGQKLPGSRLTADIIPWLAWDPRIDGWATDIGPMTEPTWNDALLYFAVISPDLTEVDAHGDFSVQEQSLLDRMDEIGRAVERAKEFLEQLDQGVESGDRASLTQPLDRLLDLSGNGFVSVYESARNVYGDYRRLEEDLATLDRLERLAEWADEILKALEYLQQAQVPQEMAELSIQRIALQQALTPEPLLQTSRGWMALVSEISRFKSGYAVAYRSHHQTLHQTLPTYQHDLESAKLKLRAHALLNTLPELGEPTGSDLSARLDRVAEGPSICLAGIATLDLETVPWCQSCRLSLDSSLPTEQLKGISSAIDSVLGEKNRQLSNLLVDRILQGNTDERFDQFLTMVQASDLSALSNTLNEELVAFIRRLLA